MKKFLLLTFLSAYFFSQVFAQCAIPTATFTYYSSGGGHYSFVDHAATSTNGQPNQMSGFQTYEWTYSNPSIGGPYQFGYLSIADHTFPAGVNHVCELIEDVNGCTYGPYCVDITVGSSCPNIVYYLANTVSANGAAYTFTDASTGLNGSQTYSWTVDGATVTGTSSSISKTFTTSGQHQVCMTIYDYGCTYGPFCFNYDVKICNGFPDFTVSGNAPTYTFTNTSTGMTGNSTYRWNIDGTDVSTSNSVTHTFPNGAHNICLYIQNGNCAYSACQTYSQGSCNAVVANFNYNSADGYTFNFTNASTGTTINAAYAWTVDGLAAGTSTQLNRVFTSSGEHEVCLTITQQGCTYNACATVIACTIPDGGMSFNASHSPVILMRDSLVSNDKITSHSWTINGTFVTHDSVLTYTFVPGNTYHICDTFSLANECSYINCEDYLVPPAVSGINEQKQELISVDIFPNPSSDGTIEISAGNLKVQQIEVINNVGQCVFFDTPTFSNSGLTELNLGFLPRGIYVVHVATTSGNANLRWIKI